MIKCIIIEDQPLAQRVLERYIQDSGKLELVKVFDNAMAAIDFLKSEHVDLIFLDIHLPKLSGMAFLNVVQPHPQVILTTAFSEYAIESYEHEVVDYLLKPFSFERFLKAIGKVRVDDEMNRNESAAGIQEAQDDDFIFLKVGYEHKRIHLNEIRYLQSDGDYTMLYLDDARHMISFSLKQLEEKLPSSQFCRVHRSYLVNVARVDRVFGNVLYIGDVEVPIGRAYKDDFSKNYLKE